MNEIILKLDAEPKDAYCKAEKLLFETDKAMMLLTQQEQYTLMRKFLFYKGMCGFYQEMQRYLGR